MRSRCACRNCGHLVYVLYLVGVWDANRRDFSRCFAWLLSIGCRIEMTNGYNAMLEALSMIKIVRSAAISSCSMCKCFVTGRAGASLYARTARRERRDGG